MDQDDSTAQPSDFAASSDSALIPVARPVVLLAERPQPPGHPFFLSRWTAGTCFRDVLLLIGLLLAAEFAVGTALGFAIGMPELDDADFAAVHREMLMPMLAVRSTLVLSIVYLLLRWRGQSAQTIGLNKRADVVDWVIDLAIGIGCTLTAYAWLFAWLFASSFLWPGWLDEMGKNKEQLIELIPAMHPLWFVPMMLAVSVYEEVLFRGFIMTRLRRTFGGWTLAVIINTLLFTVAHVGDQTPAAMPIIAGLAVIFSIATIWRKSLVPAIVGHFLFNLSQMIGIFVSSPDWQ